MVMLSEIRPGAYYDSVILMQLQRSLAALNDVEDAGVVMATPANKELLADFELLTDESNQAGPDDLLIVIKAKNDAIANANAFGWPGSPKWWQWWRLNDTKISNE